MRYTVAAALLASVSAVAADDCSQDAWGNYYCNAIEHIVYKNVGNSGSYQRVSAMDTSSGSCSFEDYAYSGSVAPLSEEVSMHIRGPAQLKNFAVYKPSSSSKNKKKRSGGSSVAATPHERRMGGHQHGHQHAHRHKRSAKEECKKAKREDVWVTATIDGQVVSWINDYNPGATTTAAAANNGDTAVTTTTTAAETAETTTTSSSGSSSGSSSSSGDDEGDTDTSGGYTRSAYYSAEAGTADGVTFLGNYGGVGSGVFTYTFGNSLSYLSTDGTTGAESSCVLSNVEVATNKEFSIWTDSECSGSDCGYYQDGSVAYHGFSGADKVFVLEFSMPLDSSCSESDFNCDMPAIWLLNALIPRTAQYNACSCWGTGCGEFDIFEVLYPHDERAKTTIHTNNPGGSSDYFVRPTGDYAQIAVVFDSASNDVAVKKISGFDFGTSLARSDVEDMLSESGSSVFEIAS